MLDCLYRATVFQHISAIPTLKSVYIRRLALLQTEKVLHGSVTSKMLNMQY